MQLIPLSQCLHALVDDDDFAELSSVRWHAVKMGTARRPLFYAARNVTISENRGRLLLMHRAIMNAPAGTVVDHKNHATLDNRKENLRLCTQGENMRNMRSGPNKHGFRGIARSSPNRFSASICISGKSKYLGMFLTAEDAARAYDRAALDHFGEFAKLNFPGGI